MKHLFLVCLSLLPTTGYAQLARVRVVEDRAVDNTFFSTKIGVLPSVETIRASELSFSIMHSFGPVNGGVDGFWGLDNFANIRLGFDYGLTDAWSVGIGRSRVDKVVDLRTKYAWLRQTESGSVPVSLVLHGGIGWDTRKFAPGDPGFVDRMHATLAPLVARKFSECISTQVSPLYIRFADPQPGAYYDIWALGLAARYRYSDTAAFGFEWVPVLAGAQVGTYPHAALTYDLETGGHVFQMFFATGDGLNEAYAVSRTRNPVFDNGSPVFRFGFNVNRIFRIGGY